MKKILAFVISIFAFVIFTSTAHAEWYDQDLDPDPPAGNIGAICKDGTKTTITLNGACMLRGGRTFWLMPNGNKIRSLDHLNAFYIEPYYSNWKSCAWQTHPTWDFDQVDACRLTRGLTIFDLPTDPRLTDYSSYAPKYTRKNIQLPSIGLLTGSLCSDGWMSPSTGSGTCSWHGGISTPITIPKSTYKPIEIKPWKMPVIKLPPLPKLP
jgi:hypothetical protein